MSDCIEKHTQFQPTDDQWKCPKCGAGNSGGESMFYIDESPNGNCELLHNEDYIVCVKCKSSWTGKGLSTVIVKALNLEKCPHCNGTGFVNKSQKPQEEVPAV